jgi:hypothetical protein
VVVLLTQQVDLFRFDDFDVVVGFDLGWHGFGEEGDWERGRLGEGGTGRGGDWERGRLGEGEMGRGGDGGVKESSVLDR